MRGGFLVRPLIIALTIGCAGVSLSFIEELVPGFSDFVPPLLFTSHSDPQMARVILAGIASSIIDRHLHHFRHPADDPHAGLHAVLPDCMAALPAAHSPPHPFAPVVTVMGAMLLALACVGCLLFFRIASETEAVIDDIMPRPPDRR